MASQIRDSENTEAGARFVYALQGKTTERLFQRFRSDPDGARILAERRSIREALMDRARLRALPLGSLGQAYAAFMDAEGISLEGLDSATSDPAREIFGVMDAERQLVHDRITDLHDLWHVATGGELATFNTDMPVDSVAFLPDGNTLAACCRDKSVILWHVDAEKEVLRIQNE